MTFVLIRISTETHPAIMPKYNSMNAIIYYAIRGLKGTQVNNRLINEIVLKDGDLIEFGAGGPRVRFRIKTDEADVCKPLSEMLEDSFGYSAFFTKRAAQHGNGIFKQLCGSFLLNPRILLRLGFSLSCLSFAAVWYHIFIFNTQDCQRRGNGTSP